MSAGRKQTLSGPLVAVATFFLRCPVQEVDVITHGPPPSRDFVRVRSGTVAHERLQSSTPPYAEGNLSNLADAFGGRSVALQQASKAPRCSPPRALIVNRFCIIPRATRPLAAESSQDGDVKACHPQVMRIRPGSQRQWGLVSCTLETQHLPSYPDLQPGFLFSTSAESVKATLPVLLSS